MRGQYTIRRNQPGAFTLVEILIVVIILGILASIVIPQFSSATTESKRNTMRGTLNAVRGQIEFYMLQHGDVPPPIAGSDWTPLTEVSTYSGKTVGPYLQAAPVNAINGFSDIMVVSDDALGGDAVATPNTGFVYNSTNGKLWATNTTADKVYNEVTPSDPNN